MRSIGLLPLVAKAMATARANAGQPETAFGCRSVHGVALI